MFAPQNLAPLNWVRCKVFKNFEILPTWIILYQKSCEKCWFGSPDEGGGGQQKVTVLFTFKKVENVGQSLKTFILLAYLWYCNITFGEMQE